MISLKKKKITGVDLVEAKRIFIEIDKVRLLNQFHISERDYNILSLRFVERKSLKDIAAHNKLSIERVRQICSDAVIAMRGLFIF